MKPAKTRDEQYMSLALTQALEARARGNPGVAAALISNDRVLSIAANAAGETGNPLRHAEIEALNLAIEAHGAMAVAGCTCYTTMEPCPMCASALIQAGVRRIVLGARHDDVFPGRYGNYRIEDAIAASRATVRLDTGLMREDCARLRREDEPFTRTSDIPPRIDDASAWTAATLDPKEWHFELDAACRDELIEAGSFFDRHPISLESLGPQDAHLPACRSLIANVRFALDHGPRFALIDRMPLDDLSETSALKLYWILMSMIARPVAQKHDGSLRFSVRDTGAKPTPGSGIRPAVTNVEQHFHNDNAFNGAPPDNVALLCIHPAAHGGFSRVVSVATIHNVLAERYPESLKRLYSSFAFDRQREHHPDECPYLEQPVFRLEDRLRVRLTPALVHAGQIVKGEALDPEGNLALKRLVEVANDPALWLEFRLERGQIQVVNNHETGHARTAFDDTGSPTPRRLERLWLRRDGRRTYHG